ncbi:MAG: Threonylcarbamoyl-AMP synthase [Anaerolineales bacterium]|nr:Threonylcarbamoyl-AMP synthase [Anaerolineales bacterium]
MPPETKVAPAGTAENIQLAADTLQTGGMVAYPTDTVYGVAAHGFQPEAIAKLYEAKERPRTKAIALLIADADDVQRIAQRVPESATKLAARFWPGALTLIVPRTEELPLVLTAGSDTVAVRMPDHPVARRVIAAAGAPLATTSANLSGGPDPITAGDVLHDLDGRIELILDGGACTGGVPSTILDLTTDPPVIRRAGPIDRETLAEALGQPVMPGHSGA